MEMDRFTEGMGLYPLCQSNGLFPYTQCKFDGDEDGHRDGDGTCKQTLNP